MDSYPSSEKDLVPRVNVTVHQLSLITTLLSHKKRISPKFPLERTANTLINLICCQGDYEYILGAH